MQESPTRFGWGFDWHAVFIAAGFGYVSVSHWLHGEILNPVGAVIVPTVADLCAGWAAARLVYVVAHARKFNRIFRGSP